MGCWVLTKEEAERVLDCSPFFKGCFEHGMQESARTRAIKRSNLTLEVAEHLIGACVDGSIYLDTPEQYQNVLEAADEVLIDLCLCYMIHHRIPPSKVGCNLSELWELPKRLEIGMSHILPGEWFNLIESNILLLPTDPQIVLKLSDVADKDSDSSSEEGEGRNPDDGGMFKRISSIRRKVICDLSVYTNLGVAEASFQIRECLKVGHGTCRYQFALEQHPAFEFYTYRPDFRDAGLGALISKAT
eukprot:Nitzschia sp. Nitz4//scaffold167_size49223//666//1400//NITZ4_007028-RA/size49223-processed-gene-0.53-mRNA-1//-1//CDS//3329538254//2746//frame0